MNTKRGNQFAPVVDVAIADTSRRRIDQWYPLPIGVAEAMVKAFYENLPSNLNGALEPVFAGDGMYFVRPIHGRDVKEARWPEFDPHAVFHRHVIEARMRSYGGNAYTGWGSFWAMVPQENPPDALIWY